MTFGLECNSPYVAAAAGAASSIIGLDYAFVGLGAPPAIHWALAGAGIDRYCKGKAMSDTQQMAMAALYGYMGGFAITFARNRGIPFTGPLLVL